MTGYTGTMIEKNLNFNQFAWMCARAFGALIAMRDTPLDAPIPEQITEDSFTSKMVDKYKSEVAMLEAMTHAEALAWGETKRQERIAGYRDCLAKASAENEQLLAMIKKVEAWSPPSEDHKGMKQFMLEQLRTSLNDLTPYRGYIASAEGASAIGIHKSALTTAREMIVSCSGELVKERERVAGRNLWIKQLRDSVPYESIPQ